MRVILQGSLRHFGAAEVLSFVAADARSGTLSMEHADQRGRLLLQDGRVAWAESATSSDALAVMIELAGWTDGTFTLLDDVAMPEGAAPLELEVAPLVAEAMRRIEEKRKALDLYPDDQVIFRVVRNPPLQSQISLSPDEFRMLFQIGDGRALVQLLADLAKPPLVLYPVLQKLEENGLIEIARHDPEATMRLAPEASFSKTVPGRPLAIGTLTSDDGTMHPLLEDELTIGRIEGNAIVLNDGSVSSHHARVYRIPEGFVLDDLKSRNGTFVNGERVAEQRALLDGDVVRLGKVLLTFNIASDMPSTETTQPETPIRK